MNTLIGKSNNKGLNWARSKKVILFTEIAGQARNDGHNRHIHSRYSDESQNLLQVKETFRTSSGNRMNRKSAIFLLLLCLFFGNVQATVRYVKSGATGTGASWANASGNLQAMINASASGDEVWVAAGTYKPAYTAIGWTPTSHPTTDGVRDNAFVMKPGVKIYGGFPTGASDVNNNTLSSRNWVANQTILSGDIGTAGTATDNIYHVVIAAGNLGTALLDGFTITGGYGNTSSSITVNGRSIARNYGAGITVHGTMTFSNLTVKANIASSGYGSGIHLNGNSSEGSTFTNIVIAGNTGAQDGGGIYVRAMTHTMSNVTVADNKAGYGGGICIRGGALHLRNSIVWGNTGSGDNLSVSGGTLSHSYNLIQGESVTTGLTTIVSNANPLFINAASGDYRLQASSPAIDYGNNASTAIATDLEGKPRIQGCKIDLGAYESSVAIVPT
ncbi:MAG: hypothetical protein LBK58_15335, partial [Prevotellaceae bacterium]|nr:hypothetical protein [Prevotellaceae bacterium]